MVKRPHLWAWQVARGVIASTSLQLQFFASFVGRCIMAIEFYSPTSSQASLLHTHTHSHSHSLTVLLHSGLFYGQLFSFRFDVLFLLLESGKYVEPAAEAEAEAEAMAKTGTPVQPGSQWIYKKQNYICVYIYIYICLYKAKVCRHSIH